MRVLEKMAFTAGLVVIGITAVYRYVLSDEQRGAVKEIGDAIREATREVMDTMAPLVSEGPTRAEEEAASEENRARTAAQWASLGY